MGNIPNPLSHLGAVVRQTFQRIFGWSMPFGELVIVVVGVLIALGVDSWWDERQERQLGL